MKRVERIMWLLLAVLATFAAVRSVTRAWTCDDAFISYRYADNLAHGHGLVFNPGERVEGYTNFVFVVVLAGGIAAGMDPRSASIAIGLACYFAVAAMLVWWSCRRRVRSGLWVPVAASLWLVQDDLQTWATGGLETTMFGAFALGAFSLLVVPQNTTRRHRWTAGVLLALTMMIRPDGVLFVLVGLAVPFVVHRGAAPLRQTLTIATPVVVAGAAYAAFKLQYYGRLLPTAFYAKGATAGHWEQGLVYVGLYFAKHWSTAATAVFVPLFLVASRSMRALRMRRDAVVALIAFGVFVTYVAESAGDYMFARRLVPSLPFLFCFLDAAVDVASARIVVPVSIIAIAGGVIPYPVLPPAAEGRVRGIADEREFYHEGVIETRKAQAELAKDVFGKRHVRAAFGGGMCMFAYYSKLPDLVEPNGLTQYWIAIDGEDRLKEVGHKGVSREVLRAHSVLFIFHNALPPISASPLHFDEMVVAGMLRVEILTYDDEIMTALARDPRVRFRPIATVMGEAVTDVKQMPCDDARATHRTLRAYWLDRHPADDARFRAVVDEVCSH